ncbi:hypothetical protein ACQ4LE_002327 [Meloidogyne hapla]|uniref:Uncharacterized protein n=1 Tax=Meloidogyne hapla TaxID=6305 RepID=A0A1I8AYR4_MELHA
MFKKRFSFFSFFVIEQLVIIVFLSISDVLGEKIPDAKEIDQYDDPMLDEIFKETNSDIQKIENAASINQPIKQQKQNLQTINQQNQLQINSEHLNIENVASSPTSSQSFPSVINPNVKPPAGSLFQTELIKQNQNSFDFPQNPYGGGFDQYSTNNNNMFARTPLTDFAYQAGQTFYSGVRQASRLLGIDSGQYQQYEVPLLSQSARLFGRRK